MPSHITLINLRLHHPLIHSHHSMSHSLTLVTHPPCRVSFVDPLVSLLSAHEAPVQGSVYVTSFRLIFRPAAADQAHALISLPLGIIEKVDKVLWHWKQETDRGRG
jgi:hypothetical protein